MACLWSLLKDFPGSGKLCGNPAECTAILTGGIFALESRKHHFQVQMNIRKLYCTMNEDAFQSYLNHLKRDPSAISVLSGSFFCFPDQALNDRILQIHQAQADCDSAISTFSVFAQKQIIQSYLINEIQNTNRIENIHTTKRDIFPVMNKVRNSSDRHIRSVVNSYTMLLDGNDMILQEESVFTFYGISMNEIMEQTSFSKRTVIHALNDLRKQNLLVETKFGRITCRKAQIPEES